MSLIQISCALLVPLLWGFQFVVIKTGLVAFPPLFFVGVRFAVIAALLLPFVGRPTRRELGPMVLISIFLGGLNFALTFVGLAYGRAGVLAVAQQLSTPFTVLLAWPFLGERPSLRMMLGLVVALGGVALSSAGSDASVALLPVWLIIGGGLALAVGNVLTKHHGPFEPLKLMAWMALLTVPQVMAASALIEHGQLAALRNASATAWWALAYTVFLGGIAGFGLWFWLIRACSMTQVAPYALLQPVFAVAAGVLFLHEPLSVALVAGMLMCITGVAITQRRRFAGTGEGPAR
ncbi:EamA family transporter [Variovorax sp. J2P1-59]|uniref:DMT family transporter n=1 Tax=Variovorax flavidus TaxID=3053501 RepID=UPI002577D395|nr:EamA family transporter [Variovorax sp. J2P1-59]MDM0074819.1 EamA family transporter [Variovorax sp. J2P1-59]